jgi:dynein heavy chain, axonemal
MINDALTTSLAEARRFNSRENLFERDITDYSKVNELNKDFVPYSNLWLTTTQWIKNIELWMYGQWFDIDADQCERFVEDALKNLLSSIRYFKDKEIVHILKIAESVKAQVDEFRPKVPLLIALRKKGLRERHWEQLSKRIGTELNPNQDFTFSQALSMGLLKHV